MTIRVSKHRRAAYCLAFGLAVLMAASLLAQRECCQGDWWLRWNPKARETYVFGYALGYQHGHGDGCHQGTKDWPAKNELSYEKDPTRKCLGQDLDFSKGAEYFANAITDFYKRYPKDRDIFIYEVLEQLGRGLTIEQIHKYPFMRHSVEPGQ